MQSHTCIVSLPGSSSGWCHIATYRRMHLSSATDCCSMNSLCHRQECGPLQAAVRLFGVPQNGVWLARDWHEAAYYGCLTPFSTYPPTTTTTTCLLVCRWTCQWTRVWSCWTLASQEQTPTMVRTPLMGQHCMGQQYSASSTVPAVQCQCKQAHAIVFE